MATLREYFDTDFKHDLSVNQPKLVRSPDGDFELEIIPRLHYAFDANAKYISYFVPETDRLFDICLHLITNLDTALSLSDGVKVGGGKVGEEMVLDSDLQFTGRVFLYHDGGLSTEQTSALHGLATERAIALRLRGVATENSIRPNSGRFRAFSISCEGIVTRATCSAPNLCRRADADFLCTCGQIEFAGARHHHDIRKSLVLTPGKHGIM